MIYIVSFRPARATSVRPCLNKTEFVSLGAWPVPTITALEGLEQLDCPKFETSLG